MRRPVYLVGFEDSLFVLQAIWFFLVALVYSHLELTDHDTKPVQNGIVWYNYTARFHSDTMLGDPHSFRQFPTLSLPDLSQLRSPHGLDCVCATAVGMSLETH